MVGARNQGARSGQLRLLQLRRQQLAGTENGWRRSD
jgi:hypothetical protein